MIDYTQAQERRYDARLASEEETGERTGRVWERLKSDALDVLLGRREYVECGWNHTGVAKTQDEGFLTVLDNGIGHEVNTGFMLAAFKAAHQGKGDVCAALLNSLAEAVATRWANDYAEAVADAERP